MRTHFQAPQELGSKPRRKRGSAFAASKGPLPRGRGEAPSSGRRYWGANRMVHTVYIPNTELAPALSAGMLPDPPEPGAGLGRACMAEGLGLYPSSWKVSRKGSGGRRQGIARPAWRTGRGHGGACTPITAQPLPRSSGALWRVLRAFAGMRGHLHVAPSLPSLRTAPSTFKARGVLSHEERGREGFAQ